MKKRIQFVLWGLIVSISLFAHFPQEKVNNVIFEQRQNKADFTIAETIPQHSMPLQMNSERFDRDVISLATEDLTSPGNRDILYIGPGPDTTFITTDFTQDDDIVVFGQGTLVVDDAMLTLGGNLFLMDAGTAIFRNNAHLHFDQYYVGQYYVWMLDDSSFEATDATVDANGVMHYAQLHDNCSYFASNTYFPDWTFRKVFNSSSLILEDVDHVGDIMVDDSCFVHLTCCDTLMPWFEMPDGSVVNMQFPDPEYVEHFELSDETPGVDGIYYTFIADSCSQCWWSLETLTGCDVTINNSIIRGSCVRMFGENTISISGIEDYAMHSNLIVPLDDRNLVYNNTYVFWWNWYPFDDVVFNIDSCSFGEMIGRGNSEIYATNCFHDGATIMLGSGGDALVSFVDGISHSYVGTFNNSTFLFVNSTVTPMWPYQSTNIAHDNSYLLAVNSSFEYEPEAMDSALAMFALLDSLPDYEVGDTIEISGSAWIEPGEQSSITFDSYTVHYAPVGTNDWTLIEESTDQVSHDVLAEWDTSDVVDGDYDLMLTISDSAGDSLIALRAITLLESSGVGDDVSSVKTELLGNYPNPFNPSTTIAFSLVEPAHSTLCVYNIRGRRVATLLDEPLPAGEHSVTWQAEGCSSGIYFARLTTLEGVRMTKLLLLK
ncbi:MAG: T9SS type A sorting domain-containing protein [Candidatus Cloacimonetes bacterium]|nr:T9SS type A sorting domain-containing protein [Candidatus Cloacimonadota bacterium]